MPITNGRYVNPGWVNGQPPAINASELNAVSDTLERLTSPGGRRGGYVVVGTSTSGTTAFDCDFLCDGTADDVEINSAIQMAQTLNMSVLLLGGRYYLQNPIIPTFNMLICGQNSGSYEFPPSSSIYQPNESVLVSQSSSLSSLFLPQNYESGTCSLRLSNISIGSTTASYHPSSLIDLSSFFLATIYLETVNMYTEGATGIAMPTSSLTFFANNSTIMKTVFSGISQSHFNNCNLSSVSFEDCGSALASTNTFLSFNTFSGDVNLKNCARFSFLGNVFEDNLILSYSTPSSSNIICGLNNISANTFANGKGITLGQNTQYNMITNNGGADYNGGSSFTPWAGVTDNGSNNYVANNMPTS